MSATATFASPRRALRRRAAPAHALCHPRRRIPGLCLVVTCGAHSGRSSINRAASIPRPASVGEAACGMSSVTP